MASRNSEWLTIGDLRGGRNGTDPASALRETECADSLNVDWHNAMLARKRNGSSEFVTANGAFIGTISALGRHVPRTDDGKAELWAVDDHSTPVVCRLTPEYTIPPYSSPTTAVWDVPTLRDSITSGAWDTQFASVDGKFFIAYRSAVNRLHVWDGSSVRRAGLADATITPSAVDTGSGTYAATKRYYRFRWVTVVDGVTTRRGEPSPVREFTPSGSGAGVSVSISGDQPVEGETHWEVEVSLDGVTFYVLAQKTLTENPFTDSTDTATYADGAVSATTGTYTVPKSYKFIAVDQNRLLGFGSWTPTDRQNRIEFSAVAGSLNISDVERVPTINYIDLDENDSGAPTGLIGPVNGSFFAFKSNQIWKLTPTGNTTTPYALTAISKKIGAVDQSAILVAEDEFGAPAIYFMSRQGPYRWGQNGLEYIGHGIEDLLLGPTSQMNRGAEIVSHGLFHADKRQVWFWVAVGSETEPQSLCVVYSIGRVGGTSPSDHDVPGSWTRFSGEMTRARASVMFSQSVGQTTSRTLVPYIAYTGALKKIWKCDQAGVTTDAGTPFIAYVTTRAYYPWGMAFNGNIGRSFLQARAARGVDVYQHIVGDYGAQESESEVSLSPLGAETRVRKKFEGSRMADVGTIQITIGDDVAIDNAWQLDALAVETIGKEIA